MRAIADGTLQAGDRVPSTRMLASTLRISRSAVVEAYETLCGLGVLESVHGSGTRVASGALSLIDPAREPENPDEHAEGYREHSVNLTVPSRADTGSIDMTEWNKAWRVATDPRASTSDQHRLESVLEDHLRSFRGVALHDNQLVIRPAMGAAIADLVHGFDLKNRGVGIEDPGYPRIQRHLVNLGCRVHWIPVDDEGLRVDAIGPDVAAVHVMPARQWPTGVAMSQRRREQLLRWSERTGGIIIENDHDAELAHDQNPPPTLYCMGPGSGRIAYVGSSSSFISPGMEVVWMVVPPGFNKRADDVAPVSDFVSRALAYYIGSGAMYRHRNRALPLYRERRQALVKHVDGVVPGLRIIGDPVGTEVVIALPTGCDELAVQMRIEQAGFRVSTLGDFAMRSHQPALVVGFGDLPPSQASTLARAIARACTVSRR